MGWRRPWLSALVVVSLGLNGCAVALVGAGAMGGYGLGKDSVTSAFDTSPNAAYRASLNVLKRLGQVTTEDKAHGLIEGKIGDSNVTITITSLTKKTVEVKVKARGKYLLPKIEVAQEVHRQIDEKL